MRCPNYIRQVKIYNKSEETVMVTVVYQSEEKQEILIGCNEVKVIYREINHGDYSGVDSISTLNARFSSQNNSFLSVLGQEAKGIEMKYYEIDFARTVVEKQWVQ